MQRPWWTHKVEEKNNKVINIFNSRLRISWALSARGGLIYWELIKTFRGRTIYPYLSVLPWCFQMGKGCWWLWPKLVLPERKTQLWLKRGGVAGLDQGSPAADSDTTAAAHYLMNVCPLNAISLLYSPALCVMASPVYVYTLSFLQLSGVPTLHLCAVHCGTTLCHPKVVMVNFCLVELLVVV